MAADERRPVPAGPPVQFTGLPAGHPACLVGMRADWIAFYDAEYHFVVRFVMRNGASLEDACDAAEEAFLDSWALMTRQPDPLVASGQPAVVDSRCGAAQAATAAGPSPPSAGDWQRRDSRHRGARAGARRADRVDPGGAAALRSLDKEAQAVMAFRPACYDGHRPGNRPAAARRRGRGGGVQPGRHSAGHRHQRRHARLWAL